MDDVTSKAVQVDLATKYGERAFMYTEYPHKKFWSQDFDDSAFRSVLKTLRDDPGRPILLYVHIPYCEQLCWFCTCHMSITRDYGKVDRYMDLLHREIDLFHDFFQSHSIKLNVQEIHLGGGSPTFLKRPEFTQMREKLQSLADIDSLTEFAIEIDPRRIDKDMLKFYHEMGINRISFGIQDFDVAVQEAINRIQPEELTENLLTPDVRQYFHSVNFDVICGLPKQTTETMRKTMEAVVRMSPDRVCFNYLHLSPQFAPHQKLMKKDGELPDSYERKMIFLAGADVLLDGGYVRTGYDHFAKPSDKVAQSMQEGKMHWNSLGYTPGESQDILGLGPHSYSNIRGRFYSQNVFEESEYEAALLDGKFPIYRGYGLTTDDQIRREVINALRGYFLVDFKAIEALYNIDFGRYFAAERSSLEPFIDDGIVEMSENAITITALGREFADQVCSTFDNFIDH